MIIVVKETVCHSTKDSGEADSAEERNTMFG